MVSILTPSHKYETTYPSINIKETPHDPYVIRLWDRDWYRNYQSIPWKRVDNILWVAAVYPSPSLLKEAKKHFKCQIKLVHISASDFTLTLYHLFALGDVIAASESLPHNRPDYSYKQCSDSINSLEEDAWGIGCSLTGLSLIAFCLFPYIMTMGLITVCLILYTTLTLSKIWLFFSSMLSRHHVPVGLRTSRDKPLPIISLLIPIYKEEAIIPELIDRLQTIDYPRDKYEILLIVEQNDKGSINCLKSLLLDTRFTIISVPYSLPQTKAKACNFALQYSRGEYIGILDADDAPAPQQLKAIAKQFAMEPPETAVIQCRLNYYNHSRNLLTRFFSFEYHIWFDHLLPGLSNCHAPIPLGGSSNYFRREVLIKLGAWDAYNVTEDADLGIRAYREGYRCALQTSLTNEEAPYSLKNWIKQRGRWIKGYLQTYHVHMQHPYKLAKELGWKQFIWFQLFIGLPCLIYLISPIIWAIVASYYLTGLPFIASPFTHFLAYSSIIALLTNAIIHAIFAWIAVPAKKPFSLILSLFFPFYWVLHSLASYRALWQLMKNPFYWDKTEHFPQESS